MCLSARKSNPYQGVHSLEFDKNNYVICFKAYDIGHNYLTPPCYPDGGEVLPGWIVSDRKSKKICKENGDICYTDLTVGVEHGIHVFITENDAIDNFGSDLCAIVPVRCHKSQLVAVSYEFPVAVFMKVFLKKEDFEKATSLAS